MARAALEHDEEVALDARRLLFFGGHRFDDGDAVVGRELHERDALAIVRELIDAGESLFPALTGFRIDSFGQPPVEIRRHPGGVCPA